MRRHPCKIATLPKEIRDLINTMMDDGETYAVIAARLAESGHPNIKRSLLSRWFYTGFQDWLYEHRNMAELRTRLDFALKLGEQGDPDALQQATLKLASLRVFEILLSLNVVSQTAFLAEHPENFVKFLSYLPKSCRASLDLQKCRDAIQARQVSGKSHYALRITHYALRITHYALRIISIPPTPPFPTNPAFSRLFPTFPAFPSFSQWRAWWVGNPAPWIFRGLCRPNSRQIIMAAPDYFHYVLRQVLVA